MGSIADDPVHSTINENIKRGISLLLSNGCYVAATALSYSAIDTMAYLAMPASQDEVNRSAFEQWCKRYLAPLCGPSVNHQLSATDLYAARCGLVHKFGIRSRLFHQGKARMVGYHSDDAKPSVIVSPKHPEMVLVNMRVLVGAVLLGIDRCLIDLFADSSHRSVVEFRLQNDMFSTLTGPAE